MKYPDGPARRDFCPGCGYHWITHGHTHRADCTADETRRAALDTQTDVSTGRHILVNHDQ